MPSSRARVYRRTLTGSVELGVAATAPTQPDAPAEPAAPAPVAGALTASQMKAIRGQIHGPNSVWNTTVAAKGLTVSSELSATNGKLFAYNLARQSRYDDAHYEDHVMGWNPPGYGTNLNTHEWAVPLYVVPQDQPRTSLWWSNWTTPWNHVGTGTQANLEGVMSSVPLPTLSKMKPGKNGFDFSRAHSAGATTVWSRSQTYGQHSWGGGNFTISAATQVGSEWQLTISPGLAAASSAGQRTGRPFQMESNAGDKHLAVLQQQADGKISLWEFWGFRPDGRHAGGYCFGNAGYVEDTRSWNGLFPSNLSWGARASNMSAWGGVITLEDVAAPEITHALGFAIPVTGSVGGSGIDLPATREDGGNAQIVKGVDDGGDPGRHRCRMGGFYRLPNTSAWSNSAIDTYVAARLSATNRPMSAKILRCIRDYGMYVYDTAGNVAFYGEGSQSADTIYSPWTNAEILATPYYGWYNLDWWDSLVKMTPTAFV